MEQLVRHSTQVVLNLRLFVHLSEFTHVDEATVKDDFSLGILLGTL